MDAGVADPAAALRERAAEAAETARRQRVVVEDSRRLALHYADRHLRELWRLREMEAEAADAGDAARAARGAEGRLRERG